MSDDFRGSVIEPRHIVTLLMALGTLAAAAIPFFLMAR